MDCQHGSPRRVHRRVRDAGVAKSLRAQPAGIAAAAGTAPLVRVVAGMGQSVGDAEASAALDDLRLGELQQGRVNAVAGAALPGSGGRDVGELLECPDESRTAERGPGGIEWSETQ